MTQIVDHIISNITYNWYGAYLCAKKYKKLIIPKITINEKEGYWNHKVYNVSKWQLI